MGSAETSRNAAPKKRHWIAIMILALVGLSLLGLICVAAGVLFFTVGRVEQNVTSLTAAVIELAEAPALNQIAFVGNDGNLWLVSPDWP